MPHAIEWSLATPKTSAFLPSSNPIRHLRSDTLPPIMTDLRRAMTGVRAMLLDLDGVIVLAGEAVPGAADAVAALDRRGMPYRIVTNTSAVSRETLSRWSTRLGAPIPASRFESALSASAAWTARHFPGAPLYVLASEDARREFAGQRLMSHDEAAARGATAAAVVIGDSPEEATYDNLNRAFRLVLAGAVLVGMHRNAWWLTPEGPTLDSGAFVAGLEFASGRTARVIGKPSPAFFSQAVADLRGEAGRGLARADIAMIGDDVRSDVRAAQRAGLRGIFVLSGKHGRADVEVAAAERGGRRPDAIAASLAEVVAALD
jgi:HAD superfamily hydrolase (TIGR01458 family)